MLRDQKCKYHKRQVTHVCSKHLSQLCLECKPAHINCNTVTIKKFEGLVTEKICEYQKKIHDFTVEIKEKIAQPPNANDKPPFDTLLTEFSSLIKKAWENEMKSEHSGASEFREKLLKECEDKIETLERNKVSLNIDELADLLSPDLLKKLEEEKSKITPTFFFETSQTRQFLVTEIQSLQSQIELFFTTNASVQPKSYLLGTLNTMGTQVRKDKSHAVPISLSIHPLKSIFSRQKQVDSMANSMLRNKEFISTISGPRQQEGENGFKPNESLIYMTRLDKKSFNTVLEVNRRSGPNADPRDTKCEFVDVNSLEYKPSHREIIYNTVQEEKDESFSNFEDDIDETVTAMDNNRVKTEFEKARNKFRNLLKTCTDDVYSPEFFDLKFQKQISAYLNYFKGQMTDAVTEVIVAFAKL